jgi:Undecaprenyl-phosphate glucose phosphotransferase
MNQIDLQSTFRIHADAALAPDEFNEHVLADVRQRAASALARQPVSRVLVAGFARLAELFAISAAGFALYLGYVAPEGGVESAYAWPVLAGSVLAVLFIQLAGGYEVAALRRGLPEIGRAFIAWTVVFAVLAVAAFLAKAGDDYSRVWFATWYVVGLISISIIRLYLSRLLRRWTAAGRLEQRAVIVGGGKAAEDLIRAIDSQPDNDIRICGIFDDRRDGRSPSVVAGYQKLGNVSELVDFARVARIDFLIVALPITAENRLLHFLKQLWVLPVDVRLAAHAHKLKFRPRSYSYIGDVPFLDVIDKPIADWDVVAKFLFDRLLGGLLLILALPIMALVALAVRLDSKGPALFKQRRFGFNNELIEVYKFRSMYTDKTDSNAARLVTKGDPRVTRVGRFIRKTSLDELPQLFNVAVRGNLSLVGPRPHAVQAKAEDRLYEQVVDGYFARHKVKPGITGWAQISGWRGETDTAEKIQQRVDHDLYYIENWSVLFDLYIVLMTPIRLLKSENAY